MAVGPPRHTGRVREPFIGSEALASGVLTRHRLRTRFVALHPDVYTSPDANLTAVQRGYAAWLWSRRRGVVAGQSASALHRAKWVDAQAPVQLLYEHRRPPAGIHTWLDRVADDEIQAITGIPVTTPARTALDLACRYPLVEAVAAIDALARATRLKVADVEAMQPERIVISPGPCTPQDAGISIDLIRHFAGKVPLLGVCLGHQAIGAAFGGNVVRAPHLMHGKTSAVTHDNKTIFNGLPSPMTATSYHSLIVEENDLPEDLEVSAWTTEKDGSRTMMGLRHKKFAVEGVQFHPESVLTDSGKKLVGNFLRIPEH